MRAAALALALLACGPSPEHVELGRTAATFASEADVELRTIYAAELELCFTVFREQMPECLLTTKERWQKVRDGLAGVRSAWCKAEPEKCK